MKNINLEKYIWNESEFSDLGWHDNRILAFFFEYKDFKFILSIDYIYKWENDFTGYWVAPAILSFQNVSNLNIDIAFNNTTDLIIEEIRRAENKITPNGLLTQNKYIIRTNVGNVVFFSTGFELELKQDPRFSESQDISG